MKRINKVVFPVGGTQPKKLTATPAAAPSRSKSAIVPYEIARLHTLTDEQFRTLVIYLRAIVVILGLMTGIMVGFFYAYEWLSGSIR